VLEVPGGSSKTVRLRLAAVKTKDAFGGFEKIFKSRIADADEFYQRITPQSLNEDERRVHRQALAGMLWSKHTTTSIGSMASGAQESSAHGIRRPRRAQYGMVSHAQRRRDLHAGQVGVPWYAAWDLAFHTQALALVDFDFAKEQLLLMLRNLYAHPNGQIPAYEWNFSDVNPPVHAWATYRLFKMEETLGRADMRFLERAFQGLMLNFNWWVNRKDPAGRNVFAGGFLGLDNIGVFDRSAQLPTADRWSRRTERRGWRFTASACWRSP